MIRTFWEFQSSPEELTLLSEFNFTLFLPPFLPHICSSLTYLCHQFFSRLFSKSHTGFFLLLENTKKPYNSDILFCQESYSSNYLHDMYLDFIQVLLKYHIYVDFSQSILRTIFILFFSILLFILFLVVFRS